MITLSSRRPLVIGLGAFLCLPTTAEAHVKWFCGPIDPSLPPLPLREVVTPLFLKVLVAFAALVLVGAMLDALLARFVRTPLVQASRASVFCDVIVRLGLSSYAVCLWLHLALVMWADPADTAILTPDLYPAGWLVSLLQLAIAVAVLVPQLSLVAGAGLMVLYGLGVAKVGPVYMIDYLFFPGLGTYVALSGPALASRPRLQALRTPVLIGSLSFSLMWTAIEKFLFPQWTVAVLVHHPGVTAGYPLPTVATIAGFVEFSLAFYLLAGREVLGRIGAVLLTIVFVAAMPEFGVLDVVGHIPLVVILLVALLTGETPLQVALRRKRSTPTGSALVVGQAYGVVLVVMSALYYGVHALSVRT